MSLADALIPPQAPGSSHENQDDWSADADMQGQTHSEHDEEQDADPGQDEDMQDLFGEDTVAEEVKHESARTPASSENGEDALSESERRHREAMEYAEEDEPEPMVEQVLEASAAIPNIPVPRSSDGNHWVIRMPNFVKMDSKPFHPDTYVGPEHEEEEQSAESLREKSMSIKLKVENTIRWRWVKDEMGEDKRQSNSRIIKWSDGSLSLKLGKELFDITQTVDTSGAVQRQAIGPSQGSQSSQPPPSSTKKGHGQGLTYLVAQHKRAGILQCEALVTGYMSLRPTGMQSETHRMLVRAVGQKHSKVARLRMALDPMMDPEREKMELLKMASKKTRKPRTDEDGLGAGRRRRQSYTRKRRGDDMWSDDEEEEVFGGASEDEYGADASGGGRKRRKTGEDNPKKGPGEYQTDDFLVSDSDEEGGGDDSDEGASRKRKGRRHRDEGDDDEDDLEKLEAKIDQQEAEERKRRQREGQGKSPNPEAESSHAENEAMDIESEEEEEDFGVRRSGTSGGARKKRAIDFEEEEE
ncbi:Leo1-domain-containing protein [Panus rudis PR-1116 ss-1]|nr:Leo1-domain-containing protein [Panus rudis PR-1116 ss-1]